MAVDQLHQLQALYQQKKSFGIVTTGQYWVENLSSAVLKMAECDDVMFKSVESTGLNATEYVAG